MNKEGIEFEELVKAELKYPEKWDTAVYTTVWEALWESYSWLKAKVEILEQRVKEMEAKEKRKKKSITGLLEGKWEDVL